MRTVSENHVIGVGMSGGADSSMTAYLLHEAGCQVRGYTMKLWHQPSAVSSDAHIARAAGVCKRIGVPHTVLDMSAEFDRKIVCPFVETYRVGQTPSPCVRCNIGIKFGALLERMKEDGCTRIATGHYAQIVQDDTGRWRLRKGNDSSKDQSYFLAGLSQEQLAQAVFPLGAMEKTDVKAKAAALDLIPHTQSESQDLCFIPDGDYTRFLTERDPDISKPGRMVTVDGTDMGEHQGTFRYTIGQRRGLGLSGGPWYVVKTDSLTNTVVIGRREDLFRTETTLYDATWQCAPPDPGDIVEATAQVRYNMPPVPVRVHVGKNGSLKLCFAKPVSAVTPGQFAVMYEDDLILGGGWICEP